MAKTLPTIDLSSIEDLKNDPRNANFGSERGREAVKASLEEDGAARSIVVDRNGFAIAGNKTLEAAKELGLEVEFVHSNGEKLIAVVRDDLDLSTDPKAKRIGVMDNRSAQLGLDWDLEVLGELLREIDDGGLSTDLMWDERERNDLLRQMEAPSLDDLAAHFGEHADDSFWPTLHIKMPDPDWEFFWSTMAEYEGEEDYQKLKNLLLDARKHKGMGGVLTLVSPDLPEVTPETGDDGG